MRLRKLKKLDSKSSEDYKTHDILHPKVFFCLFDLCSGQFWGLFYAYVCICIYVYIFVYNLTQSLVQPGWLQIINVTEDHLEFPILLPTTEVLSFMSCHPFTLWLFFAVIIGHSLSCK